MCVCMCMYVVCLYVCMYVCMYACMHVYVDVYITIHYRESTGLQVSEILRPAVGRRLQDTYAKGLVYKQEFCRQRLIALWFKRHDIRT